MTREQALEAAREVFYLGYHSTDEQVWELNPYATRAGLRALLDAWPALLVEDLRPLLDLHRPVTPVRHLIPQDAYDAPVCEHCDHGAKGVVVAWPCPTAQHLEQMRREAMTRAASFADVEIEVANRG